MTKQGLAYILPVTDVENSLDNERYRDALNMLERHRTSCSCFAGNRDAAIFLHLYARTLHHLGEDKRALIKVKAAQRLMRDLNDGSSYAAMKMTHGRILVRLGRLMDAAESFNESYVFYKRSNEFESMLYPLDALAHVHYISGNLRRSSEVFEQSILCAEKHKTRKNVDIGKRNLAVVLVSMGEFRRAMTILESIDSGAAAEWEKANINRQRGIISLYRLELTPARDHLTQAQRYFEHSGSVRDANICSEFLGLMYSYECLFQKARGLFKNILEGKEPTASAVAQTLRMLTDVYIAEGKFRRASSTAKKAEDAINKIGERIELGALYRAYGQIYAHKGEIETARNYFKKSIDLLKEIGARYELALSYFACGNSESYNGDNRLRHLEAARMLFVDMDVPKRVEQVDDAILDLKSSSVPNIIRSKTKDDLPVIIAVNREMKRIITYAEEVAGSELSVLLTGETGTGKDLLARYIHCKSGRRGKFVTVNAAAIPNEMIESELFGYKKGAFTGAVEDKPGRFELADNGTFYLNEIGDATPEFQAKLLEVLEAGQVWRLGECKARKVNFRLIAATNHDLAHLMSANLFRLDLYHRLNEVPIALPSLTDRPEDIPYLVRHFLTDSRQGIKTDGGNAETVERLTAILSLREYPGNVRELKFRVNELLMATGGNLSGMVDLALDDALPTEKERLEIVLEYTDWNRSRAAWILGVSEGTIRHHMKKLRLSRT